MYDLLIVGGGAAGMMAAVQAGRRGLRVLLAEKGEKTGRKLLITGKGRCNVTSAVPPSELMGNIPRNPRFLYSAFSRFNNEDTIRFFESAGVPLKTERGARVFPQSDKASDIRDALMREMKKAGVSLVTGEVSELLLNDGKVTGVRFSDGREMETSAVLLATGGASYPTTGSDGGGYKLAEAAGHTIVPPAPSLIPMLTAEKDPRDMMGLSLKNVRLTLLENGKAVYSELGEMLFTHFGVSGPLVLSASAHIPALGKKKYTLSIDLKPGLTPEQLDKRLLRDFSENLNRDAINAFGALLPRKMIPAALKRAGIPFDQKVRDITHEEREALLRTLKGFTLTVTGFRPVEEAIVTRGGVSVKEVDPKTMASKKADGLYFAGEILDVDGYTGGFNLTIAFSTAYAAAEAVAERVKQNG